MSMTFGAALCTVGNRAQTQCDCQPRTEIVEATVVVGGSEIEYWLPCPNNTVLTGGSCDSTGPIARGFPSDNGWVCIAAPSPGPEQYAVFVAAICLSLGAL